MSTRIRRGAPRAKGGFVTPIWAADSAKSGVRLLFQGGSGAPKYVRPRRYVP